MDRTTIQDYYAILNVSALADQKEISANYKKLVSRYHPDRHMDNELQELAEEKIKQLNEAYEVLSDSSKRQAYDRRRSAFTQGNFWDGEQSSASNMTVKPIWVRRMPALIAIVVVTFLALRFVRSPRILASVGLILVLVWLGPYLRKRSRRRE